MNSVEAQKRLDEINAELRALTDERAHLSRLVSTPNVDVVLHYWRRFTRVVEPSDYTLEEALNHLQMGAEENWFSPIGVEVNGVMIEIEP